MFSERFEISTSLKLRRRNHINPEWRDELYTVAAAGIKVSKLHARKSRFLDKLEKSQRAQQLTVAVFVGNFPKTMR